MDEAGKKAGIRLRHLSVHAVAFVDEGANLTRWARIEKSKARTTMAEPGADPGAAAGGGQMPAEAQKVLIDQLGTVIEGAMAILDFVKSAQPSADPAATVPGEVCEGLEKLGMLLMGLGDQYEQPEGDVDGVQMTAEQVAMAKTVAKGVAASMVKSAHAASVAKGGKVKMSFDQAMKIHGGLMAKLYDMLKEMAPLMSDMGGGEGADENAVDALAGGKKKPVDAGANGPASADAPPGPDALATLTKRLGVLELGLDKIGKARPPSNAAPPGAPPLPADPNAEPMPYGENLSKKFKREQQAAKNGSSAPVTS